MRRRRSSRLTVEFLESRTQPSIGIDPTFSGGGAPKAITATAHKLARIIYNLMRYGVAYMKKEESAYAEEMRGRQEKSFHRRAKELGYEVKKIDPPKSESVVEAPAAPA